MWKSFGDKFDMLKHDEEKYPRRFKGSNTIAVVLIFLWMLLPFVGNIFDVSRVMLNNIIVWGGIGVAASLVILLAVKYFLNHKEVDCALIIAAVFFIFAMYMLSQLNELNELL